MATQPKPGSIVHVEFHSRDPARSKDFYNRVFGWKFQEIPEMKYTLWEAPTPPHGGLQQAGENLPPGVLNYLLSKEINDDLSRIQANGGAVLVPKSEIQGQGWFAVFQDPTGTVMALFQGLPKPRPATPRKKATKRAPRKASASRKRKK